MQEKDIDNNNSVVRQQDEPLSDNRLTIRLDSEYRQIIKSYQQPDECVVDVIRRIIKDYVRLDKELRLEIADLKQMIREDRGN